jgi:hypothetical protein
MPHLRVDPAYYERIATHDLSKFAEAINDVGPAPCTFHNCERYNKCKIEEVECFAFRAWVNNGEKYLTQKNAKGEIKCLNKLGRLLEPLK